MSEEEKPKVEPEVEATSGEKLDDDGISHKVEGGISLKIMHEKTAAGTHFISAKLV